ncbi:MAG TPA: hypothetical protein DCE41_16800 [Cytophagales bacterium]|nr:hypothetical protein [Cytophagales bacterium]HAP59189.1 hypothetical protein [Cytophagales bacterium]
MAAANGSKQVQQAVQLQAMANRKMLGQSAPIQRQEAPTNNTGLPDNLKAGVEQFSGHSMDDVKVHYNSDKPAQLNAHAYAQGTDIHLSRGQEKHLPHEAWHVVQQKQGRVQPTMQMKGALVNDNPGLEREADVMGAKAVQLPEIGTPATEHVPTNSQTQIVQRLVSDAVTDRLYMGAGWQAATNADGNPVTDALNPARTQFNDVVKPRIMGPYGINPYTVTFDQNPNPVADAFARAQTETNKGLQMQLLIDAWNVANPGGTPQQESVFINKMNQGSPERRSTTLNTLNFDYQTYQNTIRVAIQEVVNQNHYLLPIEQARLTPNVNNAFAALIRNAIPVLLPQDYLENDGDSDVDFQLGLDQNLNNPQKGFVCGLISIIYQTATSVTDRALARQKVSQLLAQFDIDLQPGNINLATIEAGRYLPNNAELYDTLVARLHRVLQPQGTLYDLDRYSEQMLTQAGYTRIVACNCDYHDLPANIPPHITLKADATYVFHIQGHAQAVKVLQDIPGEMGAAVPNQLDAHGNYFHAFNETTSNYNLNWWQYNITSIWKE